MLFIAKVFSNLLFQILVMYFAAKKSEKLIGPPSGYDFGLYILKFLLLIIIAFVPMPISVKFLLLTVFSALAGTAIRSRKKLESALKETAYIFLVLVIVGVISVQLGIDLRPVGIILMLSLIALLIFRLFNLTSREDYVKLLSIVFAIFVIFDTNNILQRDYDGDFVDATLDYFQDFSSMLNLNMANDDQ